VSKSILLYSAGLAVFDHAHDFFLPFFNGIVLLFLEFTTRGCFFVILFLNLFDGFPGTLPLWNSLLGLHSCPKAPFFHFSFTRIEQNNS